MSRNIPLLPPPAGPSLDGGRGAGRGPSLGSLTPTCPPRPCGHYPASLPAETSLCGEEKWTPLRQENWVPVQSSGNSLEETFELVLGNKEDYSGLRTRGLA